MRRGVVVVCVMADWVFFPLLLIGSTLVGVFLAHMIGWLDGDHP